MGKHRLVERGVDPAPSLFDRSPNASDNLRELGRGGYLSAWTRQSRDMAARRVRE